MRVAPPRTTKTPSPGKWNDNREAHRADCVRIVQPLHRYLLEFDFRYNNRSVLGVEDTERSARADRDQGKAAYLPKP